VANVVIENPILNSPYDEPDRHFKFSDEGITNEIVGGRRVSSYFVPIARPKKKGAAQMALFDTEWTQDRIEENKLVNDFRRRVGMWRKGGYLGVTPTTARLIAYWPDPGREKKLFFCQNEALGAAIYIFGGPGTDITTQKDGHLVVTTNSVDICDPTTGQVRSAATNDIACWFIETGYNGGSFFVRHVCFTGAEEPYRRRKHALRSGTDEAALSALYSTVSLAFARPESGRICCRGHRPLRRRGAKGVRRQHSSPLRGSVMTALAQPPPRPGGSVGSCVKRVGEHLRVGVCGVRRPARGHRVKGASAIAGRRRR
jgi:hypothetical protein